MYSKQKTIIYFLPLVTVLIWSVNIVITKLAIHSISAISINFYRWALAFIIFTPFVLPNIFKKWNIIKIFLPKLATLSLLGMQMFQVLMYISTYTTTATNMGVLNALIPILTISMVTLLLKEKPNIFILIGNTISLAGIFILIGQGNPLNILHKNFQIGDILVLLAILSYSMYGVLNSLWKIPLDLFTNIYLQIFFNILFHTPFLIMQGLSPINSNRIWFILYAGTLPSLVASIVWLKAIRTLGPSRISIFLNLIPILSVILAIIFLGEQWQPFHTISGLLILTGVVLSQYNPIIKLKPRHDLGTKEF